MISYILFFQIIGNYLRLVNAYWKFTRSSRVHRRWWVKRHLRNKIRDAYGACKTIWNYYYLHDHEEFFNMCRMTPYQFDTIHNLLKRRLNKRSRRRPLSTTLRLALTLNFLANGDSIRTTSNLFLDGYSTTYRIIEEVCPIIWNILSPLFLRNRTAEDWKVIAHGFNSKWNFPNCMGAIDGKEIRIMAEAHSGSLFYNYKKFYSIKMLAMCDAFCRFTWIDIGDWGSISDLSAFKNTTFYKDLEAGRVDLPADAPLPNSQLVLPYFFIGDAIFELKRYLMLPYARNINLNEMRKNFNYRLSRARNTIEDSFGILCARWRILHTKLCFKLTTSTAIVKACVCLHNFLMTYDLAVKEESKRYGVPSDNIERDNLINNLEGENSNHEDDEIIPENVIQQREMLMEYLNSQAGAMPNQ